MSYIGRNPFRMAIIRERNSAPQDATVSLNIGPTEILGTFYEHCDAARGLTNGTNGIRT